MQGCDVLALFGNDFADDFAKALDKMGWMIIRQPKTPGRPAVEHEPAERIRCPMRARAAGMGGGVMKWLRK